MKDLNHSNIIKLIDFKEDSFNYYCIYDYNNGGKLSDYLKYLKENNKSFSEEEVQYIMKQLVEAVKYLHNKKIVHRNIKPKNIFLYYNSEEDILKKDILKAKIKLAEFYISAPLEKGKYLNGMVDYGNYMAPEIMKNKDYNEKVDIWNLGVIFCELIELLSYKYNFDYDNKIKTSFQKLSKEEKSFINCAMKYDPKERISADELSKHEFLNKNVKDFTFQN